MIETLGDTFTTWRLLETFIIFVTNITESISGRGPLLGRLTQTFFHPRMARLTVKNS